MQMITKAVTGAAAGTLGALALDRLDWFMWNHEDEETRQKTRSVRPGGEPPAHVMVSRVEKALDLRPTPEQHDTAGKAVHFSIGIVPAIGYAFARHTLPGSPGLPRGLLYGLMMFLAQDEALNTVTGLGAKPGKYPWQAHARGLIAHLVYGATTEIALNAMERLIGRRTSRR